MDFRASEIHNQPAPANAATKQLASDGVTAPPLRDGILVRKSQASKGKVAIEEVSGDMTSYVLPVYLLDVAEIVVVNNDSLTPLLDMMMVWAGGDLHRA
jgi:hypothetical protein